MASGGRRRSERIRHPVKTYAEEQAAENELASSLPAAKRQKRRPLGDSNIEATFANSFATRSLENLQITKPQNANGAKGALGEIESLKPIQLEQERQVRLANDSNDWHASAAESRIAREQGRIRRVEDGASEKRLRPYVDLPSEKFNKALKAANTQRMYVISRERSAEADCHARHTDCPFERIQLAGSTGNVYSVTISHLPSCTCPVGLFQAQADRSCCKHVVYVLHNVLKAPDKLKHQNALLTSELRDIFNGSPALTNETAQNEPMDRNRKDLSDDCPICFTEFDRGEDITWCRAGCGNNIHKGCFEQWERTKAGKVTCPFCRVLWQDENAVVSQQARVSNITIPDDKKAGGYRNVRHLLADGRPWQVRESELVPSITALDAAAKLFYSHATVRTLTWTLDIKRTVNSDMTIYDPLAIL
nr:e3 ubiquitin-protein ligase zswim2 [Quercus suber]